MFTEKHFELDSGLVVPTANVATIGNSACVIEGVSRSRNALINGDWENYDWVRVYKELLHFCYLLIHLVLTDTFGTSRTRDTLAINWEVGQSLCS